jgi:hypothetical protein
MNLMHIPPGSGFASKRVFQERRKVRFMYREMPDNENDSGWRFFSGAEDQAYSEDPANFAICALATVAEIDPDIVGYLDTPAPCAFERAQDDDPFRRSRDYQFEPE